MVGGVVSLGGTRGVEVVCSAGAVEAVKRDSARLRGVEDTPCNPFVTVAEMTDGVLVLSIVGGVEVVGPRCTIRPIQRDGLSQITAFLFVVT